MGLAVATSICIDSSHLALSSFAYTAPTIHPKPVFWIRMGEASFAMLERETRDISRRIFFQCIDSAQPHIIATSEPAVRQGIQQI